MLLLVAYSTQVQAQNKPHTCLWQVHKPGMRHTSYLFGTFHEANGSYFSSLTSSAKQLARPEILFVERRSEEMKRDEEAKKASVTWNASKWNSLLTSQQQGIFTSFVEKAEDSSVYRFSPLVLRLGLFKLYEQNFCDTLGRTSGELLDQYIERLALAHKIPVKSLDTSADRMKAFSPVSDSLSEAGHAAFCVDLMQAMLQNDHSKCGSTQEYKSLDVDYEFEQSGRNVLGLLERNTKWMSILDKAFQKSNCFVAVGFRHLMYKQGLIQQLRSRGYTVTPVPAR
ncbi:MAG TPA: TraB/GumN family protein [Hymenobacter sp.]